MHDDPTAQCECACVLLAAGGSRRLGRPKQLLRVDDETLLHRTTRLVIESGFAPVCVVLGSHADSLRGELADFPVVVAENAAWQEGMSTSLRTGMACLLDADANRIQHLLVMVCDQPRISPQILSRLRAASAANCECIVASAYAGTVGVPAIFPAAFFSDLLSIEGDRGARVILQHLQRYVVAVEFSEGSLDIDTRQDAERAGLLPLDESLNKVVRKD